MRLGFDYISADGLQELKNYKYHGTDKSLIANYGLPPPLLRHSPAIPDRCQ